MNLEKHGCGEIGMVIRMKMSGVIFSLLILFNYLISFHNLGFSKGSFRRTKDTTVRIYVDKILKDIMNEMPKLNPKEKLYTAIYLLIAKGKLDKALQLLQENAIRWPISIYGDIAKRYADAGNVSKAKEILSKALSYELKEIEENYEAEGFISDELLSRINEMIMVIRKNIYAKDFTKDLLEELLKFVYKPIGICNIAKAYFEMGEKDYAFKIIETLLSELHKKYLPFSSFDNKWEYAKNISHIIRAIAWMGDLEYAIDVYRDSEASTSYAPYNYIIPLSTIIRFAREYGFNLPNDVSMDTLFKKYEALSSRLTDDDGDDLERCEALAFISAATYPYLYSKIMKEMNLWQEDIMYEPLRDLVEPLKLAAIEVGKLSNAYGMKISDYAWESLIKRDYLYTLYLVTEAYAEVGDMGQSRRLIKKLLEAVKEENDSYSHTRQWINLIRLVVLVYKDFPEVSLDYINDILNEVK